MLFAVEGGGFLSSSASGYSSGLSLLLFGQKNEDRNIKVSPWNQYQLVHQGVDRFQLSSRESQVPQGCSSFTCFGCVSSCDGDLSLRPTLDPPSNQSENSTESSLGKAKVTISVSVDENDRNIWLKSSLKKPSTNCCVVLCEDDAEGGSFEEVPNNTSCFTGRRKVQWSDTCGKELTEIREFELRPRELVVAVKPGRLGVACHTDREKRVYYMYSHGCGGCRMELLKKSLYAEGRCREHNSAAVVQPVADQSERRMCGGVGDALEDQ